MLPLCTPFGPVAYLYMLHMARTSKANRNESRWRHFPPGTWDPAPQCNLVNYRIFHFVQLKRCPAPPAQSFLGWGCAAAWRGRTCFFRSRMPATASVRNLWQFFSPMDIASMAFYAGPADNRWAYMAWQTRNSRSSTSWSISAMTSRASFLSSARLSSGVAQPGNRTFSYLMP